MSNEVNTQIAESLYDRLANLLPAITPESATEIANLIVEGDLEGAQTYVETLEALHADDL